MNVCKSLRKSQALKICDVFNINRIFKIVGYVNEVKLRINSEWAALSHAVIELRVASIASMYTARVRAE